MLRFRVLLLLSLLTAWNAPSCAQFYWDTDGLPIRQGLHLGWNGAAVASDNEVTAFYYHSRRDGMRDVWGQRFSTSGAELWGEGGLLAAGDISEQRFPAAAPYPDGSVLVVWEDYANGRFRDLMAQRYDASGNPLWTPTGGVVVIDESHDQFDVRIVLDANQNAYLAFTDDRETTGGDQRLSAYMQILTPTGARVGPASGILLMDRLFGHCVPLEIATDGQAAYVLIEGMNGGASELILQKVLADGSIAWPEDPAVMADGQPEHAGMTSIPGGLAIAWADQRNDFQGDVRLLLMDYNRTPLAGWPAQGFVVAEGPEMQFPAALIAAPDSEIVLAWGEAEHDLDNAMLTLDRYGRNGTTVFADVSLGLAALQTSPVDLAWDGANLLAAWTERLEYVHQTIRTQKLSPPGQKLWGDAGNAILSRTGKALRADLVKPPAAPARLFLLVGRTVDQPESLFTATLNAQGLPSETPDVLAGGITYDVYHPRVAEIAYERALLVWSDSRSSLNRELYIQILNGHGESLLEPQGRKITNDDLTIYAPPTIAADGMGGAFVAWTADSAGVTSILQVQHVGSMGEALWPAPTRLLNLQGFQPEIFIVPDGYSGLYVTYSAFSAEFILRARTVHINAAGSFDWSPAAREFDGLAGSDMALGDAATDGQNGLFVAITGGPWTDTHITLFHLGLDGTPGTNWTLAGITFGETGVHEQAPHLLEMENGVVLTYQRANTDENSTYSVRGIRMTADGNMPWGSNPRILIEDGMQVTNHVLSADGTGGFFVTWEDARSEESLQVRINRFSGDGFSQWDPDGRRAANIVSSQSYPAVSPDGNGGAWMVWEDDRLRDEWGEIDLFATHLDANGYPASINGFTWPEEGDPMVDLPSYQQEAVVIPWVNHSALAIWVDRRSSNPGRCCGAGAVRDIFNNIYAQVLSEISLGVDEERTAVRHYELFDIYPNPFNPATQISYALPTEMSVRLSVVNLLGQEVAVLANEHQAAGEHTVEWNAAELSSGLYFARLETAAGVQAVRKLVLMK